MVERKEETGRDIHEGQRHGHDGREVHPGAGEPVRSSPEGVSGKKVGEKRGYEEIDLSDDEQDDLDAVWAERAAARAAERADSERKGI